MNRAAGEARYFFNNRPLCLLSTVFSLRDLFIGFGLAFNRPDLSRTILHHNLDQFGGAWVFGVVLMVVGIYTAFTALRERTHWTQYGLRIQSWFWLFATVSYLVNGNFLLGMTWLFCASIPAGYIAFYYKFNPIWDNPKREFRLKYHLDSKS